MIGTRQLIVGGAGSSLRRFVRTLTVVAATLCVAGIASLAAASATGGAGAGKFAATFDARAGSSSIVACPGLGPEGRKLEARYEGTFVPAEFVPAGQRELSLQVSLQIRFDRSTGVGIVDGRWQLADPSSAGAIVGRGELVATVMAVDAFRALELEGVLIGLVESADPRIPAQRLVGNFTASLGDGATFPHLKGTVGDPSVGDPSVGDPSVGDPSVGDPTGLETNPAALLPAIKC